MLMCYPENLGVLDSTLLGVAPFGFKAPPKEPFEGMPTFKDYTSVLLGYPS